MSYRYNYGSTPMGSYGRYGADTFREYDRERYQPKDYVEEMNNNFKIYNEQKEYAPKEFSMQSLNDTLESEKMNLTTSKPHYFLVEVKKGSKVNGIKIGETNSLNQIEDIKRIKN